MSLVVVSHIVNVAVAGLVGTLLLVDAARMTAVFGERSPARQILACVYLAIAAVSASALFDEEIAIATALVLFPLQILYKLATLAAVDDLRNPVPWWNLAIASLHAASLASLWRA